MKKELAVLFLAALTLVLNACGGMNSFVNGLERDLELDHYDAQRLDDPSTRQFSAFIYTVLANTQELRTHQLNGETDNVVYIHDDGREAVFRITHDENGARAGEPVTDCLNMGSFNYFHPYKAPLGHFSGDILPWLMFGNCPDDPGSVEQRIEAYMLDFREGHARALARNEGFHLPRNFRFKETGQAETIGVFAKALEISGFDFDAYFPAKLHDPAEQEELFQALEQGIKELLREY